jgi:urease subunit beta
MKPGEIIVGNGEIVLNEGRETRTVTVLNTGDRPIQVGSHYHFAETNGMLQFDRERTKGFRLDVPSGASVRFAPGQERKVNLVAFGGQRIIWGFTGQYNRALEE